MDAPKFNSPWFNSCATVGRQDSFDVFTCIFEFACHYYTFWCAVTFSILHLLSCGSTQLLVNIFCSEFSYLLILIPCIGLLFWIFITHCLLHHVCLLFTANTSLPPSLLFSPTTNIACYFVTPHFLLRLLLCVPS